MSFRKHMLRIMVAGLIAAAPAIATPIVQNGSFSQTTNGTGQFDYQTSAVGWTSNGYNFIFGAGTADTSGSNGFYGGVWLWGPNNGSANGMPAASPDGGNYVAADGAYWTAPLQQTLNGLTPGQAYSVSFWWAGAQQSGYNGPTTEQWIVGFGDQTKATAVLNNASHGFTGWKHETFTFTADAPSEVLSFLAQGTPNGEPPFSLLDGVTVNPVPEPGTIGMLLGGLTGGVGMFRSRRRAER